MLALVSTFLSSFTTPSRTALAAPNGFVTRSGTQLMLDGVPFRFSGPNLYWLGLDENVGGVDYPTLFRVNDALDTARAMGGTVVRAHTLGVSVGCPRCLMPQRGQWNAEAWKHIDYAIYAARQRNLKLIIPLTDEYRYYHGGRHTFTQWRGKDDGAFWSDPLVINDFTQYVGTMLNHVNQFTGVRYRDDPTIMAWETGNELNAPAAWTATIARYIKQLDRNHLVIDGNYGLNANSLLIPEVDIVSDHFYPLNIEKFGADALHAQQAGKVFYVGEYPWNKGDLPSFLRSIEQTNTVGDSFWSLFPHADNGGFVQHEDGYTLHYPGDNPAMQEAVRQLREHAYAMRGQSAPEGSLSPIVIDRSIAWPNIVASGPTEPPPVWTPDSGSTPAVPTPRVPTGTFVTGVNFGGDAVTIHGQRWLSMRDAQARGMQLTGGVADRKTLTPTPSTDSDTKAMLNTLVYVPQGHLGIQLPLTNGTYEVYVWAMENYASNVRSWNLALEGQTVGRDLGFLPLNTWTNYGPYAVTVRDGVLNLDLSKGSGSPMISGVAVYSTATTPPSNEAPSTPTTPPSTAPPAASPVPVVGSGRGLTATYFRGVDLREAVASRTDSQLDFTWQRAPAVAEGGADQFSVRWQGQLQAQYSERYQLIARADDGVRVWLNNQLVINDWSDHGAREAQSAELALQAGQKYDLRVEYYERAGNAVAQLFWASAHTRRMIVPTTQLYPAALPPVSSPTTPPTSTPATQTPAPTQPTPAPSLPSTTHAGIRVETRANDRNATDPWIKPWLRLTNTSSVPIPLSEITVRYWYTNDTGAPEDYVCDYTPLGCANVRGRMVRLEQARANADSYLEISFTDNAGNLAPGHSTGDVQHRVNHQNWSAYNEADDYSYVPADGWTPTARITVYRNDALIAGQEPSGASSAFPRQMTTLRRHLGQGSEQQ